MCFTADSGITARETGRRFKVEVLSAGADCYVTKRLLAIGTDGTMQRALKMRRALNVGRNFLGHFATRRTGRIAAGGVVLIINNEVIKLTAFRFLHYGNVDAHNNKVSANSLMLLALPSGCGALQEKEIIP